MQTHKKYYFEFIKYFYIGANHKYTIVLDRRVLLVLARDKNRKCIMTFCPRGHSSVVEHSTADREVTG